MILLENRTNNNINLDFINEITKHLNITKDIELILTTNKDITTINKNYRGVDKATDVLSFPLENIDFMPLGSIVISIDKAREISEKLNHSLDEEIALLYIHGLLHLLGYDHEIDDGEMRDKEKEIIEYFNLPKSLIVRSGE